MQSVIEKALFELTGENVRLTGASRTDTGVHAYGQTANFGTASSIPGDKFIYALNRLLPKDVVIRSSDEVPAGFHSRFDASGKRYRYLICNTAQRPAIMRSRACHVSQALDVHAIREAAWYFIGTHDFKAFQAAGSCTETSVRTISSITVENGQDNLLIIELTGDGFLYNMVRIIAGTLIQVGTGKIKPGDVAGIIEGKNRKKAGKTAPAQGLYLMEVYYGKTTEQ